MSDRYNKSNPAVMVGLAIGDALGQPFEFCSADMITKSGWFGEYRSGAACGVPLNAGQWTDDTKMAICLAQSLLECSEFDIEDVANKYVKWYNSGDLRGIGVQTSRALTNIIQGVSLDSCGNIIKKNTSFMKNYHPDMCGNGTVMRVAPLGLFFKDTESLISAAHADASLTHNVKDAKDASFAIAYIIRLLANGERPLEAVKQAIPMLPDGNVKEKAIAAEKLAMMSKKWDDAISLGIQGTAHETVGTAVFCLLRYCDDGFKSVVVNAVRMGGDTDTRGAIAGALAGCYAGIDNIPEEYLDDLEHFEYLNALDVVLNQQGK